MQSIAVQLQHTRTLLAPVAGESAALEARMLAGRAWNMSTEDLVLHSNAARDVEPLSQLVERRLRHEPISHILGMKDFWRDSFEVTSDVLTPRADSETMIEVLFAPCGQAFAYSRFRHGFRMPIAICFTGISAGARCCGGSIASSACGCSAKCCTVSAFQPLRICAGQLV